jgi:hypothetical protein
MSEFMHTSSGQYHFIVYKPTKPGAPWLSVCFGPGWKVIDAEVFETREDADSFTAKAREIFAESIRQRADMHLGPVVDAWMH